MYQYSLGAFTCFFFKSISQTPPEEDVSKRVQALQAAMRFTVFTGVTWPCDTAQNCLHDTNCNEAYEERIS